MCPSSMNKLQGHRALVIGGSTGIGFAVAKLALEHGVHVTISSSNQGKLEKAVEKLQRHLQEHQLSPVPTINAIMCDLANPETVEDNIKNLLGAATQGVNSSSSNSNSSSNSSSNGSKLLDHVVYTAGNFHQIPQLPTADLQSMSEAGMVRSTAVVLLAKHLPPYIKRNSRSSLTITSSTTQHRPLPGWSVNNAVIGGLEPLTRGLSIDLNPLRVNVVVSGFVRTELFDGFPPEAVPHMMDMMAKDVLMNRVGEAEELAEAYLYLMRSTFATGSTVVVDGGREVSRSIG